MNKRAKITISIIIALVVLISVVPIPTGVYKDGGTRTYTALTYKVVKWHRLSGYEKTSVYWLPNNFKTLDELWEIEQSKD
jgi:hypothetical protein